MKTFDAQTSSFSSGVIAASSGLLDAFYGAGLAAVLFVLGVKLINRSR